MSDLLVENHGTICLLHAMSEVGRTWLNDEEHVQAESWQWMGDTLAVDHRYAPGIVVAAESDGLVVT